MSYNPSCFFSVYPLPFYMKDSVAEEMSAPGAAGERERVRVRGRESQGKRHRDRERGGSRRIDFHLQQLQFKASQQTSEARQDPACPQPGRAACLRAGLPLGAPGQSGGTRKTITQTDEKVVRGHKRALPQVSQEK